jgi:AAA domain
LSLLGKNNCRLTRMIASLKVKGTTMLSEDGRITLVSEIATEPVEWLWDGRLPIKEITILDGDPGGNKSSLTLDVAARLSSGRRMPLDTPCFPAGVVLLGVEDSVAKTVRPRLEAAGADLGRIVVIEDHVTIQMTWR